MNKLYIFSTISCNGLTITRKVRWNQSIDALRFVPQDLENTNQISQVRLMKEFMQLRVKFGPNKLNQSGDNLSTRNWRCFRMAKMESCVLNPWFKYNLWGKHVCHQASNWIIYIFASFIFKSNIPIKLPNSRKRRSAPWQIHPLLHCLSLPYPSREYWVLNNSLLDMYICAMDSKTSHVDIARLVFDGMPSR